MHTMHTLSRQTPGSYDGQWYLVTPWNILEYLSNEQTSEASVSIAFWKNFGSKRYQMHLQLPGCIYILRYAISGQAVVTL